MDIGGQSSIPNQELWKGFCSFIQHSYSNEVQQQVTNNFPHQHQSQQMQVSLSLLLTVGGQDTTRLLYENGLSSDDILQFKFILSKLEELCLLKLILDFEKYKQALDNSKADNNFKVLTNLSLTSLDNSDRHEASYQDSTLTTKDEVALQQSFKVVNGESPIILTELKMEELSSCDIHNERIATKEDCIEVETNKKTAFQRNETFDFKPLCSNDSSSLPEEKNDIGCLTVTGKENGEDLSTVRRSSRQIRVSSRYADRKDAIQNLLKPELIRSNNQQKITSISDPTCLCSICKKTFVDSKALMNHWKCHKKKKPHLPFLCQSCGNECANYTQLKEHFESHLQSEENEDRNDNHDKSFKKCDVASDSNRNNDSNSADIIHEKNGDKLKMLAHATETVSKCSKCCQSYHSAEDFENHKVLCTLENNSDNFKCKQCSKDFDNRRSLLNHQKIHLTEGKSAHSKVTPCLNSEKLKNNKEKRVYRRIGLYKCNYCTKSFKYERKLDFHMTLHTGEKPHNCEVCGQGFRLRRSLLNHRRLHDEMCRIKCEFCPKIFVDKKAFESHKLIHTGVKPYSCEACGKGFRRLLGLKNHQRLHKKDEAIKCDECDKTFVDKWGMMKHKSIHSGEKPFVCTYCGKMFRLKKGLQDHVKLHDKATQLQCSMCPRTFIEKRKLDLHLMAHKGEKPFICDKCGKGFMNSMNLKVHDRCHTGEKPYKCSFCGRTFNQQGSLIAHERHHKGERPYICDICGDGFITKSQLTIHKRKHSNDRPYKCDQCDYAAYTGSLLKIHKLKHSDEKPFKCLVCPSAFKRQHHLEVHSKTHLTNIVKTEVVDIVLHKCPYCNDCFGSEDLLTSHIETHEIVVVAETSANASDDIFVDQGPGEVAYNIVLL